jgi:hypothetical protein
MKKCIFVAAEQMAGFVQSLLGEGINLEVGDRLFFYDKRGAISRRDEFLALILGIALESSIPRAVSTESGPSSAGTSSPCGHIAIAQSTAN